MPTTITTKAVEQSTYVVTVAFTDEDGDAVTPTAAAWSLRDGNGAIVNSREDVSATPGTSIDIVLQGDDLNADDGLARILTVEATYNSDLGTGLPLKDEVTFTIDDLIGVS